MAGSMNWTGMEELIETVEQTKQEWVRTAEDLKTSAVNKLNEGYTGTAAETTANKMDEIIKKATNYFEEVGRELSNKLAEQKRAWEDQERKAQASVE
jgi:hypothetical protein